MRISDWSSDVCSSDLGSGFAAGEQVIVKSDTEHASLGLDAASVVPAAEARREIAARQQRFGRPFFAEAFIDGREFNLSVLETAGGPRVLPVAELLFSSEERRGGKECVSTYRLRLTPWQ